jgi:hypothetical protein
LADIRQTGRDPFGADSVKKESRERWLTLADWAIHKLGFNDWDDGLRFANSVLNELAEKLRSIDTRTKLEALLAEMPEPSRAEFEEDIETGRELIYKFRPHLLGLARKLPHSPGGPRAFGFRKREEIRNRISALVRKGLRLGVAFRRVAHQLNADPRKLVSPRTVERIWQSRKREGVADDNHSQTD